MADNRIRKSRASSADPSSNEEQNLWSQICEELYRSSLLFEDTESHLRKVNSINDRILKREKEGKEFPPSGVRKVMKLYEESRETTANQKKMLQAALDKVGILVALRDATENGTEKPDRRKKRKLDEKPRAAAAAPPKKPKPKEESVTMLGPGQPIIARPRSEGQEWIMGKIEKWVPERGMYQVKDDEDDEELPSVAGKSKELLYYLPKDVVPLATEQEAARRPVFVKDHKVLAHYPTTTCFYRAKVKLPPHKGQPVYTLLFEDDNAVERLVPAHMIVDRASTFVKAAV